MNEYAASLSIDGFVCGHATVAVERELVTIRPSVVLRWLLGTRRVKAADTRSVSFILTGIRLEKTNGRRYDLRGAQVDAIMGALRSGGFPMGVGEG